MKQIHAILWKDWDPIGVNSIAPENEYDSYIGEVYRLLASRCTREALVTHLIRMEIETMGLGPLPSGPEPQHKGRLETVADKLMAIDVQVQKE